MDYTLRAQYDNYRKRLKKKDTFQLFYKFLDWKAKEEGMDYNSFSDTSLFLKNAYHLIYCLENDIGRLYESLSYLVIKLTEKQDAPKLAKKNKKRTLYPDYYDDECFE